MEIVQGIILKTSPYSETQKIIRIYTKEKGYLSMISPSVVFKRKTKTVHLLQISEIEFFENEKSDLHKLRQISPIINLPELYFDIFKMNILLLWGEILNLILKNEGKNEELFDYLTHSEKITTFAITTSETLTFIFSIVWPVLSVFGSTLLHGRRITFSISTTGAFILPIRPLRIFRDRIPLKSFTSYVLVLWPK